ncbi:hypothetical protein C7460_11624 [Marinoscillum furvescens DSM 4134]|uniref:Alpha-L-fucosidase 2 n=2 Tax=Marinoscillum furvescens TaxID=1026 RepID=A0A3D9L1K5_MARFU|nr:hypothetical protein C7460_11624 [Marinoscillum furvescens DSM 4134]
MLLAVNISVAQESGIDWPEFMSQHDLVWEEIPGQWNEGAFVGNGMVGMMIYANMDENRLDFHVGRQDVTDHRKAPNKKTSMATKGADLYDFSRLDIGRMTLHPAGKIRDIDVRQDLYNAEVRGVIVTDLGQITFRAFTPYEHMINVIEVHSTEEVNGSQADYMWRWMPGLPFSPRIYTRKDIGDYQLNPRPILKKVNGVEVCEQPLLAGGDYATAWLEKAENTTQSIMYVSVANEIPATNVSALVASNTVNIVAATDFNVLIDAHREWWHNYFQKSFLSIPDGRMESFYWIQLYKMAACSREDGPVLDLLGPFFKNTGWPGLWWNLNVQLTYWPFNATNHVDLAENFIALIDDNFDFMLAKKSGADLGDFAWALHNYWLIYSYRGDYDAIAEKWLPKALRVLEVYQTKMITNEQGQIELSAMGSPEYHGFKSFVNTNYNLSLVRWLLTTLIETSNRSNTNQELIGDWKELLDDLIPYPEDENGLMIGSEQPVDMSHRHYSHLLGLYPLFQLDPDQPEVKELVDKSVVHWHKIGDSKGLVGYSYTGAASLYAALGRGNDANSMLQQFLDGNIQSAMLLPNTFYMEGKGRNPVIETPLSAASAIVELVLQSWGGKIRVFPATPDDFQDAVFQDLRAEGGFLVSASRKNGQTEWVTIKSLSGNPCMLKVDDWENIEQTDEGETVTIRKIEDGQFEIDLKKGASICVSRAGNHVSPQIRVIPHPKEEINLYGVKEGESYDQVYEWEVPEFPNW